jgi:alpha-glucosidase
MQAGCTARHVYLPPGTWVDFHTGERHSGGKYITAAAPLDHIPLFQRGGYVIPMYDQAPASTMDHYPELLELHVIIPDEDGSTLSMLQEDDGLSNAYQKGAFLRTQLEVTRRGNQLTLSAKSSGKSFPEFRRNRFRFVLKGFSGHVAELNGHPIAVHDGRFECPNRGENLTFSCTIV